MKELFLKHKRAVMVAAGLVAVLVTIGVNGYNMRQAAQAQSNENAAAGNTAVNASTDGSGDSGGAGGNGSVNSGDADVNASIQEQGGSLNAWGEVQYERVYDINIDFPSRITEVNVKEGDRVALGQELAALDMSEYRGIVNKLREGLSAGQAGLEITVQDTEALSADIAQLQKDIQTKTAELKQETNSDLKILKTSLALAQKELKNAQRDLKDNQALHAAGSVSKSTLDQYEDRLAQSEKALSDVEVNISKTKSALKAELDQLKISLKSKQEQLDQIKKSNNANTAAQSSSVAVSQIDLDLMEGKSKKDYLNGDRIVSSVKNGIVHNIGVINGTILGAQNMPTRVLQLIDADSIVVSAEVDEEFIKDVALGETVTIVPVSDNSLSIPGVVSHISNVAVEKDGKRIIKVEVKPQDPAGILKPGYTTDVYFSAK